MRALSLRLADFRPTRHTHNLPRAGSMKPYDLSTAHGSDPARRLREQKRFQLQFPIFIFPRCFQCYAN